jgi:hypothetical protein
LPLTLTDTTVRSLASPMNPAPNFQVGMAASIEHQRRQSAVRRGLDG